MKLFRIKKRDTQYEIGEWYVGWKSWVFEIAYEECGYESPNGELHISILGWHSLFRMPFKSKRFPYGDCDAPKWGVAIHSNTLWIYRGGKGNMHGGTKWWTWDLPFFTKVHVRHEVECHDTSGHLVGKTRMLDAKMIEQDVNGKYIELSEHPMVNVRRYIYQDSYDNSLIPCKYWVEEREWRPKWLTWTKAFKYVKRYIEVKFSEEVGKEKGSWKGGCTGCSYNLLPGETPEECIIRMEQERKF